MKKIKLFHYNLLFLLVLLSHFVSAQTYQTNKTLGKSFPAQKGVNLQIENKYGNINVITNQENRINIEVKISFKSNDSLELNKIMDYVTIEFTQNNFYITAKTVLNTPQQSFLNEFLGTIDPKIPNSDLKINYTITIPQYTNLGIKNNYGDVYIGNINGDFDLTLRNGNFMASNIVGQNNVISLMSGNSKIQYIKNAKLDLQYIDKIFLKKANHLTIDSKSSSIVINEVKMLKINSRRDKWDIQSVDKIFGMSYVSNFNIENLIDKISLNANYGTIDIQGIATSFSLINFNTVYAKMDLFISPQSDFKFDFTGEQVDLLQPFDKKNMEIEVLDAQKKVISVKGNIGSENPSALLKIKAKKTSVSLYYQ